MTDSARSHVSHYAHGKYETIDVIYDALGDEGGDFYIQGCVIKYALRALHKDQFDSDIEKIRNYAVIMQEKRAERGLREHGFKSLADVKDHHLILETQTPTGKARRWWWDQDTGKLHYQLEGGEHYEALLRDPHAYDEEGPFKVVARQ